MGQDLTRQVETYDPNDAGALVRFTGLSHLTDSLQRGRGVLLATYHSPMMRFAVFTFVRYLRLDGYMALSGGRAENWHHKMMEDATLGELPESTLAYVASVTHHAQ